jgi:L-alanine-DL-glutamate epimerase-like enolase superfamily enzyme
VTLWERLGPLPLQIESYELERLAARLTNDFERVTTRIRLIGGGADGLGEDVSPHDGEADTLHVAGPVLPLAGDWTLESFSAHLARLDLFPAGPHHADFVNFRRWAFESAALDLALRQAGMSLATALGRTPRPVSFVVSPGPEDSAEPVHARLELYPGLRLKLMPTLDWDQRLVDELAATGAVDVVDLKGQYEPDVPVAVPPDAALYRRVLGAFGAAWIEDPGVTPATEPLLRAHRDRITWDAPIRSAADIARLMPRMVNMKPSRFGSVHALLDAYDLCERAGIGMYGGGQFELGPGRGQIQLLASLFHPDAPNDVAPTGFNEPVLRPGLPSSPLPAPAARAGFR